MAAMPVPLLPIGSYPIVTAPPPDLDRILQRAAACIGARSCRDLQALSLRDPFQSSRSISGAYCRSGDRAGFVAIVVPDSGGDDGCFVLPPCPVIRSVRRHLADLSDHGLAEFPPAAKRYGFVPVPDGVIQITFFKVDAATISACRCPRIGAGRNLDLGQRTLEALAAMFGDAPLDVVPELQPLREGRWRSMTFDLCGDRLPGLVHHGADRRLLPLWAATDDGTIHPCVRDAIAPIDLNMIRYQVAKIRTLPDHIPDSFRAPRMRSRGDWLCLTDDDGALIEATVWECTTNLIERDRWRYFDHDLEKRLRQVVRDQLDVNHETLALPQRKWFLFQDAIRNVAGTILRPKAPLPFPIDQRAMLILCGFPGCGKSHFSTSLLALSKRFVRINQDELRTRDNCLRAARDALAAGSSVIIDRTNISVKQRAFFLDLARAERVANVLAILFDAPPQVCADRILTREGHPTLAAHPASVDVLLRFVQEFERPVVEEGFRQVLTVTNDSESDDLALALATLAAASTAHAPSAESATTTSLVDSVASTEQSASAQPERRHAHHDAGAAMPPHRTAESPESIVSESI